MDEWKAKALVRAMEACTVALVRSKYLTTKSEIENLVDELDEGIDHAISLTEM